MTQLPGRRAFARLSRRRAGVALGAGLALGWSTGAAAEARAAEEPGEGASGDDRLATRLDAIRTEREVPALWGGRFHADGRRVFACGGLRRVGDPEPVLPDDTIHLGSCTKAMTAALVARECSAGRLSFDTTLADLFPAEIAADSPWAGATLEDLLRHSSGAPANPDWHALHRESPDDPVAARRALVAWLAEQPRPPERAFRYSNVGYALAGHAVESIRGRPWEALVVDEVLAPLGVVGAGFGPVPPEGTDGPWGHVMRDGVATPVRVDNPPPLGPAGRVHLSIAEWAKFVLAFARGGAGGREAWGVTPGDWARLLDPGSGTYAGGWGIHDRAWGGGRVLSHAGSNTTWFCVAWVAPQRDFCLLGATNCAFPAAEKACDGAVAASLDAALLPFGADGG